MSTSVRIKVIFTIENFKIFNFFFFFTIKMEFLDLVKGMTHDKVKGPEFWDFGYTNRFAIKPEKLGQVTVGFSWPTFGTNLLVISKSQNS